MSTITITLKTQSVSVFGPAQSSKWLDNLTWGVTPWGEKSAGAGNSPILLTVVYQFMTWTGNNSIPLTIPFAKSVSKQWTGANGMTVSYANSDKEEYDGSGYNYVFIDRVTNAESAATETITSQAAAALTYTSQAAASTIWS